MLENPNPFIQDCIRILTRRGISKSRIEFFFEHPFVKSRSTTYSARLFDLNLLGDLFPSYNEDEKQSLYYELGAKYMSHSTDFDLTSLQIFFKLLVWPAVESEIRKYQPNFKREIIIQPEVTVFRLLSVEPNEIYLEIRILDAATLRIMTNSILNKYLAPNVAIAIIEGFFYNKNNVTVL